MVTPGGMTVATLTPYDASGRVDAGVAREHAAWLAAAGIRTLAPVGTTGEALYLETEEKCRLIQAAVAGASGRAAVIAGIWALRPDEIRHQHAAAADAGAAAVFLTTPIYYPATDDALIAFYQYARDTGPLPVYAYNIPQYAANEISLRVLAWLTADASIAGVKDSTGSEERLGALLEQFRGRLAVYGASDSMALRARQMGADGFISALANIFPQTFRTIWEGGAAEDGVPSAAAVEAQQAIDRIRGAVKGYGGIGALKHLLGRREFPFHGTRLPFQELTASAQQALDRVMDEIGELA